MESENHISCTHLVYAFSSAAIWSVIFQVLHFPHLAFSVALIEMSSKRITEV